LYLHGTAADYAVEIDATGIPEGAAIWMTGKNGDSDELIGILGRLDTFDLNGEDVAYFGLLA
jgi:hypothetical protein